MFLSRSFNDLTFANVDSYPKFFAYAGITL